MDISELKKRVYAINKEIELVRKEAILYVKEQDKKQEIDYSLLYFVAKHINKDETISKVKRKIWEIKNHPEKMSIDTLARYVEVVMLAHELKDDISALIKKKTEVI